MIIREFGVEITEEDERKKKGGFMDKSFVQMFSMIGGSPTSKKTRDNITLSPNLPNETTNLNFLTKEKSVHKEELMSPMDTPMEDIEERV